MSIQIGDQVEITEGRFRGEKGTVVNKSGESIVGFVFGFTVKLNNDLDRVLRGFNASEIKKVE